MGRTSLRAGLLVSHPADGGIKRDARFARESGAGGFCSWSTIYAAEEGKTHAPCLLTTGTDQVFPRFLEDPPTTIIEGTAYDHQQHYLNWVENAELADDGVGRQTGMPWTYSLPGLREAFASETVKVEDFDRCNCQDMLHHQVKPSTGNKTATIQQGNV